MDTENRFNFKCNYLVVKNMQKQLPERHMMEKTY